MVVTCANKQVAERVRTVLLRAGLIGRGDTWEPKTKMGFRRIQISVRREIDADTLDQIRSIAGATIGEAEEKE